MLPLWPRLACLSPPPPPAQCLLNRLIVFAADLLPKLPPQLTLTVHLFHASDTIPGLTKFILVSIQLATVKEVLPSLSFPLCRLILVSHLDYIWNQLKPKLVGYACTSLQYTVANRDERELGYGWSLLTLCLLPPSLHICGFEEDCSILASKLPSKMASSAGDGPRDLVIVTVWSPP